MLLSMCEMPFDLARVVFATLGDAGDRCQPGQVRCYRAEGKLGGGGIRFGKRNRGEQENL